MLYASKEFEELLQGDVPYMVRAEITLADGTSLALDNDKLRDAVKFSDATSDANTFCIGSAIINKIDIYLDNTDEVYGEYDFTDARIRIYLGLQLSGGTKEWINKGIYTVDEATHGDSMITLSALDNMHKFDKAYETSLRFPATLGEIIREACQKCEVTLNTPEFEQNDYVVKERPGNLQTFREVIYYASQVACCFARININGQLELRWYNFSVMDNARLFDAGRFTDEAERLQIDAGTFSEATPEKTYDVGEDFSIQNQYHHIYAIQGQQICTDDVVPTGITVTTIFEDEEGNEEEESYTEGKEGYIFQITENPFIQKGQTESVAKYIGKKLIGVIFRPYNVNAKYNPLIEAGDIGIISDWRGNAYFSAITEVQGGVNTWTSYRCDAETPNRNSATQFRGETKIYQELRNQIQKEKSLREQMRDNLLEILENSGGLFPSSEEQENGSYIYYLHDQKKLSESMIIWKLTAGALAVSSDGGKTYPYGITVDGDTILRIISAEGLDASWIRVGKLKAEQLDATIFEDIEVSIRLGADGAVIEARGYTDDEIEKTHAMIEVVEDAITQQVKKVESSVTEETKRAKGAEEGLDTKITQAEANMSSKVTQTAESITQQVEKVATSVSEETKRAKGVEDNLDSKITQTEENLSSKVTQTAQGITQEVDKVAASVTEETKRAQGAEGTLDSKIVQTEEKLNSKVTQTAEGFTQEVNKVANSVTQETSRAKGAESDLSNKITQTESTLSSKVSQTASDITQEVKRATQAEGELKTSVSQTADKITQEVNRATLAEGELKTSISQTDKSITQEVTRATKAEEDLKTSITQTDKSITQEVTRATKAEGELKTSITQTDNSISQEVTRATTAEAALRASININADNITSKVSKGDMGSYVTQYYNNVIVAFNNNSKYVQINAGEIAIYNNGVSASKKRSVFDENGEHFYRDNYYVGKIGTNQWASNSAHKGLVFDLEYTGKYMAWAQKASSGASTYTTILCYSRASSIYTEAGLHLGCNLYGRGNRISGADLRNSSADGYATYSGTLPVVMSITNNSNGGLSWVYGNVRIRNGMITSVPT